MSKLRQIEIVREKEQSEPCRIAHTGQCPTTAAAGRRRQSVRVLSLSVTGRITSTQGDEAEVLVGNIKLRRPLSDLDIIQAAPIKLPENVHVNISTKVFEKNEINVIGQDGR